MRRDWRVVVDPLDGNMDRSLSFAVCRLFDTQQEGIVDDKCCSFDSFSVSFRGHFTRRHAFLHTTLTLDVLYLYSHITALALV